ncbi:MAG: NAD(P)/FAD-dependent oxidoreductase [Candidatus Cloacimonetes bacterium]|nr:NAD(P)/FAD-dependent oxidoreductase [Candidatus Cloacimonadota bacterium]
MEQVNILVIGAGAVGLSIAHALAAEFEDVVVAEQEESFGRHTSSRNSEVIHSGIYYPQGSRKTELCVRGNNMLYAYCAQHDIPHRRCGKLVVATDAAELPALRELHDNGVRNGVAGLELLDSEACKQRVPQVCAVAGLWAPSTGILDTHTYMKRLADQAEQRGAFIVYDMRAQSIERDGDGWVVRFANGEVFCANVLVNAGGLFCGEVARMAGLDLEQRGLAIHWCKGEYYKTTKLDNIPHLIYPLPDPSGTFLGIHLTINLAGEVRFGPNAWYIDDIDYRFEERWLDEFHSAVNRYLVVDRDDLMPDDVGIRPKLQGPGDGFRDFHIALDAPRLVNLMGIESPGLTASPAIAQEALEMVRGIM